MFFRMKKIIWKQVKLGIFQKQSFHSKLNNFLTNKVTEMLFAQLAWKFEEL